MDKKNTLYKYLGKNEDIFMGLEKVGTKFITAWTKAGEKSLLATRPVKVNLSEFMLPLKGKNGEKIIKYIRNGKIVGEIRYAISSGNIGKYPEYYLEQRGKLRVTKPSIFISHLEGNCCGTRLMQIAGQDAVRQTEGRMVLDSQCVDGFTSPDAFYFKLGFRKLNSHENDLIKSYIDKGEIIPPDSFSDRMFLPKENLLHLLNYHKSVGRI